MHYWLLFLLILCTSCSSQEKRESKKYLKGEYLYRKQEEYFFTPPPAHPLPRNNYPWEARYLEKIPRITKEYFRCKGNVSNPVVVQKRENKETIYYRDCPGEHGLPLREGNEFIYPCLLELLNYIQEKTDKRVIITTGHRCPTHNSYCDYSPSNWGSKHMVGAEVDFYVEGMEGDAEAIVALLQNYYREKSPFAGNRSFETFARYEKEGLNVTTPPWYNKEIFIKLYRKEEGRDFGNRHEFPYIGVQVRWDRELQSPLVFSQKEAQNYLHD